MNVFTQNNTLSEALAQHDQLIRGVTQATTIAYKERADQQSKLIAIADSWHADVILE
jgi:hypothetical protein